MVGLRRLLSGRVRPARPARPPRTSLVGRPAPLLGGVDPTGEPVEVTWPSGRAKVVAFLTDGCTGCAPYWAALAGARPVLPGDPAVVIVTPGPRLESRRAVAARPRGSAEVVMDGDAWLAWGAAGAPWFAVVVDGRVVDEGRSPSILSVLR